MKLLTRTSIRGKLLFAFGAVVLLSVGVAAVSLTINIEMGTDVAQIRQAAVERAEGATVMGEDLLTVNSCWRKLMEAPFQSLSQPTPAPAPAPDNGDSITHALADTLQHFQKQGLDICRRDAIKAIELARKEGYPDEIRRAEDEIPMLDQIQGQFDLLSKDLEEHFTGNDSTLVPIIKEGRHAEELDQLSSLVSQYDDELKDQLRQEIENVQNSLHRANLILLFSSLLVLVTSSFMTWWIWRMISRPIGMLKESAERIGRGDLETTINLPSRDELGLLAQTFNQMTRDLRLTTVSRDYVNGILKSMVNALIVLRSDHTIESCNESTLKLLGYASAELEGQPMELILRAPSTRSEAILDEVRKRDHISEVEVSYQAKDGQLIPVALSASVLRNPAGLITGVVCVAQDISSRKKAEQDLAEANRNLLESSRQAGMAEVATSVLHNVGNVLNSVNVSSALISEKVQKSQIGNLTRAMALIEEHQSDLPAFLSVDPKGKQLPGYLFKLTANLVHEQKEILDEASSLAGNVLHIREIVTMQQNYARVSGVSELLGAKDLMEDAIRINIGSLERHQVKLIREYADVPLVPMEKHKVLQILVNLIGNAKNACDEAGKPDKRITLRLAQEKGWIKISVSDNGVGIPGENLNRIFAHGFTTRKEGHGFGLHSGALMAREMNGTLAAFSEGLGQGATFVLLLPINPKAS